MKFKKIITLIFILIWMISVFCLSNQTSNSSGKLSEGITEKIIKCFHITDNMSKESSEQFLENADKVIRKLAHYSLYTLGGILILLHINLYKMKINKKIIISWLIGTTYAVTDEIHQLFILGRSGEIRDMYIDSLGVITGIIIILIIFKIKDYIVCSKKE